MNESRNAHAITLARGNVFVLGGFSGKQRLNSVEKYVVKEDKWLQMAPMKDSCAIKLISKIARMTNAAPGTSSASFFHPAANFSGALSSLASRSRVGRVVLPAPSS